MPVKTKLEAAVEALEKNKTLKELTGKAKIRSSLSFERNRISAEIAELEIKLSDRNVVYRRVLERQQIIEHILEGGAAYVTFVQDFPDYPEVLKQKFENIFQLIYSHSTFTMNPVKPGIGYTTYQIKNGDLTFYAHNPG